ncbi:MAG: hypothetical protein FWC90_03170 [Oscillospiraceae bacterium]|nr:hypothetical protein [Oscillospiraceae bacterium]
MADLQGFHSKHAPLFFNMKFNRNIADKTQCDIRDMFQCPEEERYEYWKKYLLKYIIVEPARKGAKGVSRKLRTDGHTVYIITKRVFTCNDDFKGKLMRFIVRNWLWRNGIKYNEIIFCDEAIPDSKRTVCLDKHIDVMIEDEAVNINVIAPIAKVICFDTSYNRECEGENISRARDWGEVYRLIEG